MRFTLNDAADDVDADPIKRRPIVPRADAGQRLARLRQHHAAVLKAAAAREAKAVEDEREREATLPPSLNVGIAWCVFFKRGMFSRFLSLNHAYRGPSLFSTVIQKSVVPAVQCTLLGCDDLLLIQDLDGTAGKIHDDSQIFYCSTHGQFKGNQYNALLHVGDWQPGSNCLGFGNLVVAVFDTCELVNGSKTVGNWSSAKIGPKLRLLLGFDGPAIMDRGSSARGGAFAELLLPPRSLPFADAWLQAVQQTTISPYSKAIAIAFGDSQADADTVLATASLAKLPPPRVGPSLFVAHRY